MYFFAVAGFVFAILFGLYLIVMGIGMPYVVYGLTGRFAPGWLVVSAAGVGVLWYSIAHAPFTISVIAHTT